MFYNDYTNAYFTVLFGVCIFIACLILASSQIGTKKVSITRTILLLLTGFILGGTVIYYGNTQLNQVKTQLQESSKTLTVKTIEFQVTGSAFTNDFIIVNDKYKINTNLTLPKGATITIQKHKSEPYYRLIKYEIK